MSGSDSEASSTSGNILSLRPVPYRIGRLPVQKECPTPSGTFAVPSPSFPMRLRILAYVSLAATIAASSSLLAQDAPGVTPAKPPTVGLPLKTARTHTFTTTKGTWISLDVSPDGKTIVFDLLGDLYSLPIAGGKATRLTRGMAYDVQPRFSPDGKKIVFVSDRSGGENLWVM